MVYELVNMSDDITFEAETPRVAALAALALGGGTYGVEGPSDGQDGDVLPVFLISTPDKIYEFMMDAEGPVPHLGRVRVGAAVTIGANACVDQCDVASGYAQAHQAIAARDFARAIGALDGARPGVIAALRSFMVCDRAGRGAAIGALARAARAARREAFFRGDIDDLSVGPDGRSALGGAETTIGPGFEGAMRAMTERLGWSGTSGPHWESGEDGLEDFAGIWAAALRPGSFATIGSLFRSAVASFNESRRTSMNNICGRALALADKLPLGPMVVGGLLG